MKRTSSREYRVPCAFCGNEIVLNRKPPEGLSCGQGDCVQKHNDAVAAWYAANPRRPRARKVRTAGAVGDGSWGFIGAINGYRASDER